MSSTAARIEISPPAETEFAVCARLLRALSHIVRGDLSVITNDLAYLSAVTSAEELERPRARCASAAATLGKVNVIAGSLSTNGVSLTAIAREFGAAPITESVLIRGDESKVVWIARTLRSLLGEFVVRGVVPAPSERFVIECVATCAATEVRPRDSASTERYSSFGDYAARELGEREIVEASLVDLLFHGFGWRLDLMREGAALTLRITVPREKAREYFDE